jgi:hypothetical protein
MSDYSDDDKAVWNSAFAWASAWGHTPLDAKSRGDRAVEQARMVRPWLEPWGIWDSGRNEWMRAPNGAIIQHPTEEAARDIAEYLTSKIGSLFTVKRGAR